MTKRRNSTKPVADPASVSLLERVLFYLIVGVLGARPLISEAYERVEIGFLEAIPDIGGPTPATTAWLDLVLLIAAVVALARARRTPWQPLATVGALLLILALLVSGMAAADRPAALLAGGTLLAFVLAGAALVTLHQAPWMWRATIAVLIATGCTNALKCINQEYYEFPQAQRYWQETQRPALIERGFDPTDPRFVNYERRLAAGEPHGFLSHPNVAASGLVMSGLVATGMLIGAWRRWPGARGGPTGLLTVGAALALTALPAFAAWLTGSLGAIAAGLGGLLILVVLGSLAGPIARRARTALAVMVIGYGLLVAAGVAYGVARGTLPHPSLAFRWHYWTAAMDAFEAAPLAGIGRENFVYAYMEHKPAASPEEVRNPHNLWISLLVETGPLGLVGGSLLVGGLLIVGLRRLKVSEQVADGEVIDWSRAGPAIGAVLLIHAAFSATPFGAPGMIVVWVYDVAIKWTAAFAVALWCLQRVSGEVQRSHGQSAGTAGDSTRTSSWLRAGLVAAVVAALVHALLGFALLVPGGLALFVLAAGALAGTTGRAAQPAADAATSGRRGRRAAPLVVVVGGVLVAAHVVGVAAPQARLDRSMSALNRMLRNVTTTADVTAAEAAAVRLASVSALDPTGPRRAAGALLRLAQYPQLAIDAREALLRRARETAAEAIARNPQDMNNYASAARIEEYLAVVLKRRRDPELVREAWQRAATHWERAVARYPTNPRVRISAGEAWRVLWESAEDAAQQAAAHEHAAAHFAAALRIHEARDEEDTTRLRPSELALIRGALEQLSETTPASGASPATDDHGE